MKATELKIGDWVSYKNKPLKVEELGHDLCGGTDKQGYWHDKIVLDDVEPIRITEKILVINLWEKLFEVHSWWPHEGEYYALHDEDLRLFPVLEYYQLYIKRGDFYHIASIKYVHELQHILWTLGLDDNLEV